MTVGQLSLTAGSQTAPMFGDSGNGLQLFANAIMAAQPGAFAANQTQSAFASNAPSQPSPQTAGNSSAYPTVSEPLSGLLNNSKLFGSAPLWGGDAGGGAWGAPQSGGAGLDHDNIASIINQLLGGKLFGAAGAFSGASPGGLFAGR